MGVQEDAEHLQLPVADGFYLQSRGDVMAKCGIDDVQVIPRRSLSFFVIGVREEEAVLYICLWLYLFFRMERTGCVH